MNLSQHRTHIMVDYRKICFTLLILMYSFGTVGLLFPITQPYFKLLSPLNLWMSLLLLLSFHQNFNKAFIYTSLLIFAVGFGVEVLGVHTGLIFGNYWYGSTLGVKFWGVPLVIGTNWLILIYCSAISVQNIFSKIKNQPFFSSVLVQSIASAAVMVLLDLLIEPIAIRLDFWHWQNEEIPIQNYIAWFLIAFVLNYIFLKAKFLKSNSLAMLLLILQFSFFLALTLFFRFF